ncbi:MAG TPA: bifunctional UDP-sugar hydrolase/5'-nucleotidase [Longimicrobium sp.]|nr:bifunctional UDP-sugar hydrolase/5'-nucleotidase [Longimicrobium sp.]
MSRPHRFPLRALLAAASLAACSPAPPAAGPPPESAGLKRVRIVHTNDFHGRLLPQQVGGRAAGGSAVLAAHFDSAAARFDGPTIFLSAGDDMQGTAISNLSWGRATIAAHNAAGYDAAAVGNHEFDWGQDTLVARIHESRFPWLAANVFVAGTRRQPEWVRPWVMIERGGVRTAVIGIALRTTPEIVLVGRTAGLEFGAEAPAIDQAAREARAAGADFVVVTAHVGASCEQSGSAPTEASGGCRGEILEIADALAEPVDLIVGGHTHRRVLTAEDSIPIVEAASYSLAYSVTDLEARPGRAAVLTREVRVPWADEVSPDTQVARIVAQWEARVRPITERPIATLAEAMGREGDEYPLGNLIADALRVQTGAQASLVNNGSVRRALPAGPVSWGVLFELQPFANALVRVEVTGAQLKEALENAIHTGRPDAHISGMTVRYDPAAPEGQKVREIRLDNGQVVDADETVTLGLSEFIATGGDRYTSFTQGRMTRTELVDLDAVIAYLQSRPQPVRAPAADRWQPVR